jgi:Zn-dependent protease with chaperone function
MYANFIYFIVALLTVALYEPLETRTPPYSGLQAIALFIAMAAIFTVYVRNGFQRLLASVGRDSKVQLDHRFGLLNTRYAILALTLFAVDIWWLHLPSYFQSFQLFMYLPTLRALCLLMLFVGYLLLIWIFSYDAYQSIYHINISRGAYVYSNFAFSVPVLIPWTLLFTISDIIELLPFELPKQILDTPAGQIGSFLVFLLIAAVFAPLLIQRFWRCRPLENGSHRQRIEALCRRAGIRYAEIVYWPIFGGRMITAGVMGLISRFRYIMVTDALLHLLSPNEIDQVIAHEIGHVKHRHIQLYLLFFCGFMLISYSVFSLSTYLLFLTKPSIYLLFSLELNAERTYYIFSSVVLVLCIVLYFRFLFGYFMRNFERQADLYVFELFPSAQPLIDTFGKIVIASGQPSDKPNWHHFSIQQRIDYLSRCEQTVTWIRRHHRKVKKSIIVYLTGFALLALSAYYVNQMVFGEGRQHINANDLEAFLDKKADKDTKDGLLYWLVGNIYFERQMSERAIDAYGKALDLNPDHADTLNNLAWLLVTIEDSVLRNPSRALALAQRAISIDQAPHIWDTLALCLFSNGRIKEAIDAEQNALAMNPEDPESYEKQLDLFKKALDNP